MRTLPGLRSVGPLENIHGIFQQDGRTERGNGGEWEKYGCGLLQHSVDVTGTGTLVLLREMLQELIQMGNATGSGRRVLLLVLVLVLVLVVLTGTGNDSGSVSYWCWQLS